MGDEKKILYKTYASLCKRKTYPPLIIAGSGRSGTTWLLELVCSDPHFQMAFEPLHPTRVQGANKWANQYFVNNYPSAEAEKFFSSIFNGSVCNSWTLYRPWVENEATLRSKEKYYTELFLYYLRLIRSALLAERVAAKFIRANLMLPWLSQIFNASILYVVRNPYSVVQSWLKTNWFKEEIDDVLSGYIQQDALLEDYLAPYVSWIKQEKDSMKKVAILWAIGNLIPLSGPILPNMAVVPYEYLLHYTKDDFIRLFKRINTTCNFSEKYIRRSSSTTFKKHKTSFPQHDSQKESDIISHVEDVVEHFNLDLFRNDGSVNENSLFFAKWNMTLAKPKIIEDFHAPTV